MTCRSTLRALDPYVDGELEASDSLHVEGHLDGCATCAERARFQRAMKRTLQAESRTERAPDSLRLRLERSAGSIRERERVRRPSWQSAIPWAAAAGISLMFGGGMRAFGTRAPADPSHDAVTAAAAHSFALDEFAAVHASPLPPEELDPVRVTSVFSPIVGVPVRPNQFVDEIFNQKSTPRPSFGGARLMRVHNEAAATLFYDFGGKRVTVFVFDPQRIRVRAAPYLAPRMVRMHGEDKMILIGRSKGYPLATFERDGIGYAVSADMTDHDVLAIAASL